MIKPLGKQLLIKVVKRDKSKEGILLASDGTLAFEEAEVLETGDQVKGIKKGDSVYFKTWAIDEVEDKKENKHQFIHQDNILGYASS